MKKSPTKWLLTLVFCLVILNIALFYIDFKRHKKVLTVAVLDVGQGDAIFIESPTGTQILVDAGPPRSVVSRLSRMMSPFDRSLDAVIITNPDQDHIGGFEDIFKSYKVGKVFEPGTFNESRTYQNLKNTIDKKNIPAYLARSDMRLKLGGGVVLDILFPDRDVSMWDTNEGSIVAKLTYGETTVMLTGDSTLETERIVLNDYKPQDLDVDILKVGHHGSRSSTAYNFLKALTPEYALISVGADNKYGHPHAEVVDDLKAMGTKVYRTDQDGTIIMQSNGQNLSFEFKK